MKLSAGVVLACVAMAAAAPVAGAQPDAWQRVGRAPGGDSFAVIDGTPYVAYTSSRGVRVARLAGTGRWRKVGGAVRHHRGKRVADPTLVAGPRGEAWLTWTEDSGKSGKTVRVARFSKGRWREVGGGKNPISHPLASHPALGFLAGRAYVAYSDFDGTDSQTKVSRISSNGRRWQRVSKGLTSPGTTRPKLATAGGALYLEYYDEEHGAPIFRRFDPSGSTWRSLPLVQSGDSAFLGGIVGFHGRLHTLFSELPAGDVFVSKLDADDSWTHVGPHLATDPAIGPQSIATDGSTLYAAYVQNGAQHVDVFFLDGAVWKRFPAPTPAGSTASSAALAGAAGGGVWLLARESTGGKASFQLELFNAAG